MNYIINPAWFYFMSVSDGLKITAIVTAIIALLSSGTCFFVKIFFEEDDDAQTLLNFTKRSFYVGAVCLIISILVPDQKTITQMLLAKYATYDNAASVIQTVQNAADYIIESVGKLNGG